MQELPVKEIDQMKNWNQDLYSSCEIRTAVLHTSGKIEWSQNPKIYFTLNKRCLGILKVSSLFLSVILLHGIGQW